MLERIVLAAIVTFCVYLFLNLGAKSSDAPSLEMTDKTTSFIERITSFSF